MGGKPKVGWAWVKGNQRPFSEYEEIRRGKHKGRYRIEVGGKMVMVDGQSVIEWPEGSPGYQLYLVKASR